MCFDRDKLNQAQVGALDKAYLEFETKFFHDPTSINVTVAESNLCGSSSGSTYMICYGQGSGQVFTSAWKSYLSDKKESLVADTGILSSDL